MKRLLNKWNEANCDVDEINILISYYLNKFAHTLINDLRYSCSEHC